MRRRWLPLSVSLIVAATLSAGAIATEIQPFTWSAPFLLAPGSLAPGVATGYRLTAVSCGSPSMCVAVDDEGRAFTSTEPAAGGEAWKLSSIDPGQVLVRIACPLATLCVAGDQAGHILTSTNPGTSSPTWSIGGPPAGLIEGIACAGASLCAAVDQNGDLLSSTDPFAGPSTWRPVSLDPVGAPLRAVSCPSSSLCVATDAVGNVFSSTDPSGTASAWKVAAVDEGRSLEAVSCPATTFCVALDLEGNVLVSHNPSGGSASWLAAGSTGHPLARSLSCATQDRCLTLDTTSTAVSDDPEGGSETWLTTSFGEPSSLDDISCPLVTFCVTVGQNGRAMTGTAPAPAGVLNLAVVGPGHGTVSAVNMACTSSCSSSYARGTPLTLTATPAAGSSFVGWGGPCAGSAPCTLSVQRSTDLTATFAQLPEPSGFTLTVSIGGSGSVTGPGIACPPRCRTALAVGSTATFSARPAPSWRFSRWTGACSGHGACTLKASENRSLSALFEQGKPARVHIGRVSIDRRRHAVTVRFSASPGMRVLLCALRRRAASGPPRYRRCRSPRTYSSLGQGRYVFYVRASATRGARATRSFSIP